VLLRVVERSPRRVLGTEPGGIRRLPGTVGKISRARVAVLDACVRAVDPRY
jgi:hypothetical protein